MRTCLFAIVLIAGCAKAPVAEAPPPKEKPEANPGLKLSDELRRAAGIVVTTVLTRAEPPMARFNGRLVPDEEKTHRAAAIVDGRVMRLFANVGDRVGKGQVLARIHSHEIHEARSEYQKAKVELARLETQRAFAEKARDRVKRLLDLKAASVEQVELAERDVRNAAAAIESSRAELKRTRLHIEEFLDVSVDEPAGHKPGETDHDDDTVPVRAPAAGVVLSRVANTGTVVRPGDELFVISDTGSVWMLAAVPEADMAKVRVGMEARVSVRAFEDRPFTGRVTRIGDQLDAATRTVQARIALNSSGGALKPEMYATAEMTVAGAPAGEAVYVPREAVQEWNGHSVVFVETSAGAFEPRAVDPGAGAAGLVAIRQGLQPGERVVTRGSFVLKSEMLKSTLIEE
ncbi:MAG: efflux RND transporter periplasmic adaptor subunit [Acidobacteria bacterium]|nr:efflux RND transporter periplasmic adaptor subunit [Acidobacteriota bacterium]